MKKNVQPKIKKPAKFAKAKKPAKPTKSKKPIAVLLMAYGSPENLAEVEPYYIHIRGGVRPDEALIKNLENRYRQVGGKTPLHAITREQGKLLQKILDKKSGKNKFKVFIGMKHWNPFIKDTFEQIHKEGIKQVIALALAPHYSKISIGGYQKAIDEAISKTAAGISCVLIEHWHTNVYLIDCIVDQLKDSLKSFDNSEPHVIFTAHSLPERIKTWNDPYPEQLLETCRLIAAKIPGITWSFAFQSAGMTSEPWLGPDINAALIEGGKKDILVCPVGFVSDNLEIVFDLDIESQELAANKKINLKRTASRNTHPLFIEALAHEVLKAI